MTSMTFGEYLRHHRVADGVSLRVLAAELGCTHVYVGEVERGRRRQLPEKYWPTLVDVLSGVTLPGLRAAAAMSEQVRIDPAAHAGPVRDMAFELARKLANNDVSGSEAKEILRILIGDDE